MKKLILLTLFLFAFIFTSIGNASDGTPDNPFVIPFSDNFIISLTPGNDITTTLIAERPEFYSPYDKISSYYSMAQVMTDMAVLRMESNTYEGIIWKGDYRGTIPTEEEMQTLWSKIRYDQIIYNIELNFIEDLNSWKNIKFKAITKLSSEQPKGYWDAAYIIIGISESGKVYALDTMHERERIISDASITDAPDCSLGTEICKKLNTIEEPGLISIMPIDFNRMIGIKEDGTTINIAVDDTAFFPEIPNVKIPLPNSNEARIEALEALFAISTQPADAVASYTAEVDPGFDGVKVNVKKKIGDEVDIFSILLATNGNNVKYFASIPVINQGEGTFSVQIKKETLSSKDVQKWFMWWAYYVREPVTTTESYVETRTLQPERAR